MAIDKAVDSGLLDNALAATAEKIREKTGSTEEIAFDMEKGTGFADAVGAIQAGSGDGANTSVEDGLLQGTLSGEYANNRITTLWHYALYRIGGLVSISIPNVTKIESNAFNRATGLQTLYAPKVTVVGEQAFYECTKLADLGSLHNNVTSWGNSALAGCGGLTRGDFNGATAIPGGMFQNCSKLTALVMPNVTGSVGQFVYGTSSLKKIDLGKPETTVFTFSASAFNKATGLEVLILRFGGVVTAGNSNIFNACNLLNGGKVFVPAALLEQYENATNWSTWFNAGNFTFEAIEGSVYE